MVFISVTCWVEPMAQVNKEKIITTLLTLIPISCVLPFRIWKFVEPQAYVLLSQHSKNFFSHDCDQVPLTGQAQSTQSDQFWALFLQNCKNLYDPINYAFCTEYWRGCRRERSRPELIPYTVVCPEAMRRTIKICQDD